MNIVCRREVVGELGDEKSHSGDVWIDEAEMIMNWMKVCAC